MVERRDIDERDIDQLLAALSDRQIAELYGMAPEDVSRLRKMRRQNEPPTMSTKRERKISNGG
jgi:hypothetical protein